MIAINVARCLAKTSFIIQRTGDTDNAVARAEQLVADTIIVCVTDRVNAFFRERKLDEYYSYYPKRIRFSVVDIEFDYSMSDRFGAVFCTFRIDVPSVGNGLSKNTREEVENDSNAIFSTESGGESLMSEVMRIIEKHINK